MKSHGSNDGREAQVRRAAWTTMVVLKSLQTAVPQLFTAKITIKTFKNESFVVLMIGRLCKKLACMNADKQPDLQIRAAEKFKRF